MPDEVTSSVSTKILTDRIGELERTLALTTKESITRKRAVRDLQPKYDALVKERDSLLTERDSYKLKSEATPGEQADRVKALEGQLRGLTIAGKFAEVGLAKGFTLDDVFRTVGFDPGTIDPEKLDVPELVKAWRLAKPSLFDHTAGSPAGSASQPETKRPALTVSTPAGRGSAEGGSGRLKVSMRDLADPLYMHQNQSAIAAAQASGSVDYVD
jgi:hypothetical protein